MKKITKQEFDKLYDDNISKKEYDRIIELIDSRFDYIISMLIPEHTRGLKFWYDYGNGSTDGDDSNGFFDPKIYKESIDTINIELPLPYGDGIPTRWLWEDFEDEMISEIEKAKSEEIKRRIQKKAKIEERKIKKHEMHQQIKSKLSKEELRYVKLV